MTWRVQGDEMGGNIYDGHIDEDDKVGDGSYDKVKPVNATEDISRIHYIFNYQF